MMWTCTKCDRVFKTKNQSHSCTKIELDDLFEGKSSELLLAFDGILYRVMEWEPNAVGTATKSIVFTNKRAWLIVKPMTKVLDLKIYNDHKIDHPLIHKISHWGKKYAHHIRIDKPDHITESLLKILKIGYTFGMR